MGLIPEEVVKAWEDREDAVVFVTSDPDGTPNAVYVTCVGMYRKEHIVIADNYFDKTKKNIQARKKGTILFITKEKKSYQLKGSLEYETSGEHYDFMKTWNPTKLPGHAAAILTPERIFSGARKIIEFG
ncbi:MAG TPA: pyridoxamine 5'-phosphate oxidase family protein [Spirochaetia bacterium]|nr:pyridoxamine 5'-phosphate oxidase family protein [Spirochaetia bacterium]